MVRSLTEHLIADGHDVRVITRFWKKRLQNHEVYQVSTPRQEGAGYAVWAAKSLYRLLSWNPEIVHCHGLEGALVLNLMPRKRARIIMHVHNSISREVGYLDTFRHRLGTFALKRACSKADAVLCPTEVSKRDICRNLKPERAGKVFVVPNMVPPASPPSRLMVEEFRQNLGLQGKKVLLYVGKVKRTKGIEDICKAYVSMKDSSKVALLVVGAPTWTDSFLRYLKESYPEVVFTGWVDDTSPYFGLADIFCIYTDAFEGGETFAISLAEAMHFGVPIVCSDNPIFREVTEGKAFFAEPKNPEALARVIRQALADGERRKEFSEKGKAIAHLRYRPEVFASTVESIYEKLVRSS